MKLENISIHAFIQEHKIKTETGAPLDFKDHLYMFDIYRDFSPKLVLMKAAQITATTAEIIKCLWAVKNYGLEAIYTLPTESDVYAMVGSKVNRLIAQNPIFQTWTKDKDTITQKQIGDNFIHYKGTWSEKAAIMVPSDWNLYDEVDASKQSIIEQYATRLQHSKFRWEHYFSHPSAEGTGVDKVWQLSDQRHWFIRCGACQKWQYLSWPESINERTGQYVCKACGEVITNEMRRKGEWVRKYTDREIHGYWIPLLICPWVSAKDILSYYKNKTEEYFYNKVLGLPYVGGGNKLSWAEFSRNLTGQTKWPDRNAMVVIGVDTGNRCHYVLGSEDGYFHFGKQEDYTYTDIEDFFARWPRAIAIIDQGGDLTGPRALREKYPGRVYLCSYGEDRKTVELVRFGNKDESGAVTADRNRMLQWCVDEFSRFGIPVNGKADENAVDTEGNWYDVWLQWNNLTRIKEFNETTQRTRSVWVRNGDDHYAHAQLYCRLGMSNFVGGGYIIGVKREPVEIEVQEDGTMKYDVLKAIRESKEGDWRKEG